MMMKKCRNIFLIALATALILLLPFLAMQFSDKVNWSLSDFVVAGGLLFGSGLAYELIARRGGGSRYRAAVGVAVAATLLMVWVNLAVGIIGSEDNPLNLMYFWVIGVGIVGAVAARLKPRGMALAMFAMAIALAIVGAVTLIVLRPALASTAALRDVMKTLTLDGFFAMLFTVSGLLFRQAGAKAKAEPPA